MTEVDLLRKAGTMVNFSKDQVVFSQYDPGEEMYVVLKGIFGVYINTFTGFPNRVAGIVQGSFFGEMAILDGSPRSATVISEEDSAVVVKIGKKNFQILIENAPQITTAIMTTLRNRANATSDALLKAGKKPPEIPRVLANDELNDANCVLCYLTLLSDSLRQMNNLLATETKTDTPEDAPEELESQDVMRLLPEGYSNYNVTDLKDNKDTFRVFAVVCPYCRKALKAYVPIYGQLGEKRETPDGRVIYSNLNILLYTNTICPNCNYSDTYMEFSRPRNAASPPEYEGNQFENTEGFTGYERTLNRTVDEAILSYYLNIDCLKRTSSDPLRFANAWIRLYWLYNDQGSKDFAKHAAKQARHYYLRYLEHGTDTMSVDDKMRLNMILGELAVIFEDHKQALDFYTVNTVIGKSSKSELLQESIKRCKELKKLA